MSKRQEERDLNNYRKKIIDLYVSINSHLTSEYLKQHSVKRFLGCFTIFVLTVAIYGGKFSVQFPALVWALVAWKFWPYSFWSFQGGLIDNVSKSVLHIGPITTILGKIFLQNILVVLWISLIAPISGIKTWLKAIKYNKILYMNMERHDRWV